MLTTVVNGLRKVGFNNFIVIDDGSTDDTRQVASELQVITLSHEHRRGVGAALKTGFERASAEAFQIAITIGADAQRDPKDAMRLYDTLVRNQVDLVLGVKNLGVGSAVPIVRRVANIILGFAFNKTYRRILRDQKILDCITGFRAVSASLFKIAQEVPQNGYEFDIAFLRDVLITRSSVEQVYVQVFYHKESSRMSLPLWEFCKLLLLTLSKKFVFLIGWLVLSPFLAF